MSKGKNKNLSGIDPDQLPDASEMKIGVVVARWNQEITTSLYEGCCDLLKKKGLPKEDFHAIWVPGSYELPQGARILLSRHRKMDAVICLGCVIRGETSHNEYINNAVAQGLMQLSLTSSVPCIFGLLTPNDYDQALERAGGKHGNKGVEAAATALEMAALTKKEGFPSHKIGFGI